MNKTKKTVLALPIDRVIAEAESQQKRIVHEVMEILFSRISDSTALECDFVLSNGTQCWVKKFYAPEQNGEEQLSYGFDVKFSDGSPLSHLEFSVKCTGWERALRSLPLS